MKHRILYMMIMAAAIFSCQKAEEKADVEAGFDALGRVPKVGIASEINVYQYDKQVSATVLVSGIDPDMKSLEVGLLSSLDEYFPTRRQFMRSATVTEAILSVSR